MIGYLQRQETVVFAHQDCIQLLKGAVDSHLASCGTSQKKAARAGQVKEPRLFPSNQWTCASTLIQ
jgi:hypothetical protein